jgi:hypothetical protein
MQCLYSKIFGIQYNGKHIAGGAEDTSYLAAGRYRTGLTGCIAELSVGNMVNINLLHVAERGRNIDSCEAP